MKRIIFFLLIIGCISKAFPQIIKDKVVSLPFEISIKGNEKLIIKGNGFVEFCGNSFLYNALGIRYPMHEALITIYTKNNLCGIRIIKETDTGAYVSYSLIINIENATEVTYKKDSFEWLVDFFSLGNQFIITLAEQAHAFNDTTGELLWTQTYNRKSGRNIIINEDNFIVNDMDGNRYRIYNDGRKIKL